MVISLVLTFFDTCDSSVYRGGIFFGIDLGVFVSVVFTSLVAFFWWRDINRESGEHTAEVAHGLRIGMALFIISEVMFFFSFFWAFFHVSLSPAIELGGVWPPTGFGGMALDYREVPLLNTILLLSSGVTVTYAHMAFHTKARWDGLETLRTGDIASGGEDGDETVSYGDTRVAGWLRSRYDPLDFHRVIRFLTFTHFHRGYSLTLFRDGIMGLHLTILFAIIFTALQFTEYLEALFAISDSAYGSLFFVMTGFHGLHVIIGTVFLIVCSCRIHSTRDFVKSLTGLECAIWYWHFVDVVWLFLFICIYWWGNINIIPAVPSVPSATPAPAEVEALVAVNTFGGEVVHGDYCANNDSDNSTEIFYHFQDPASVNMEMIIVLYGYIVEFLVFIALFLFVIVWEVLS